MKIIVNDNWGHLTYLLEDCKLDPSKAYTFQVKDDEGKLHTLRGVWHRVNRLVYGHGRTYSVPTDELSMIVSTPFGPVEIPAYKFKHVVSMITGV